MKNWHPGPSNRSSSWKFYPSFRKKSKRIERAIEVGQFFGGYYWGEGEGMVGGVYNSVTDYTWLYTFIYCINISLICMYIWIKSLTVIELFNSLILSIRFLLSVIISTKISTANFSRTHSSDITWTSILSALEKSYFSRTFTAIT